MADVKYRVREFTPKAGQAGSHSFFAEAVTDNVITNRELAKKVEARGISRLLPTPTPPPTTISTVCSSSTNLRKLFHK